MSERSELYGLLAEFGTPEALLRAARAMRAQGYRYVNAYSPFPIEGLAEGLGMRGSRIPLITLIGGITGGLTGYALPYYVSVISYPINVGGRPLNSWPAFVPIVFELTVLFAALFTLVGLLVLNGLPMPYHPVFNVAAFARGSRDRFFLCVEARDPHFDRLGTRELLERLDPMGVVDVPT